MNVITKACDKIGLPYRLWGKHNDIVEINVDHRRHFFIQASTPFNNASSVTLAVDKDFSGLLFGEALHMPRSKSYLNPFCDERYTAWAEFPSHEAIADDMEKEFTYPFVVKMNRGNQGHNVFLCKDRTELNAAIAVIFNPERSHFDYVLIAQEYIRIAHEYRVVWYEGEIMFLYEKVACAKNENLSPLHNESGKAVYVNDPALTERIAAHIAPAKLEEAFDFLGIDIAVDAAGKISVIELNTRPGFWYFIRDNGDEKLVEMYEKILRKKFQAKL